MKRFRDVALAIILACSVGIVASQKVVKAEITNFPNGVSSFGVPILPGIGNNIFSGDTYWVDSGNTNAADGAGGGTKEVPFKTIDFAVGQCTANNGDLILVMPGHVETVTAAAGLDLDVAGITIIGIGSGSLRPVIRFTTATTSDMDVDANNVTIVNFLFEARVDGLVTPIDLNATDTTFVNIETRDVNNIGSATTFIAGVFADNLSIDGWKHMGTTTNSVAVAGETSSPVAALSLNACDEVVLRNLNLYGNWSMSAIMGTSSASTNVTIGGFDQHTQIWTENSTDSAIGMGAGSTGFVGPNITCMLQDNGANITEAVSGASMQFVNPIMIVNLINEVASETNIARSADE